MKVPTAGTDKRDTTGGVLVASAALLFGVVVILGKIALRSGLPVLSILAVRFGITGLVLLVVVAVGRRPLLAAPGERIGAVVIGIAGYGFEATLFLSALRFGTAAAVTLLFYTYPVVVALATWAIDHRRPSRLTMVSLVAATVGAAIVIGAGGGLDIQSAGIVLALACACAYTGYLLGADRIFRRTNALTGALWVAASASVGLFVAASLAGQLAFPTSWSSGWAPIVWMSLATAGAFVCLLEGLQRLGAVRTAIVSASEPLFAVVLAFVFLGESVMPATLVGGSLIVAGAVIASVARAGPERVEPPIP